MLVQEPLNIYFRQKIFSKILLPLANIFHKSGTNVIL
jgi:hypothetical protein